MLGMYIMPEFPANDLLNAVAIGIVSGFASTGVNRCTSSLHPLTRGLGRMYDRQKVITIALAEVGYLEKASNAQLDDKTANAGKKNFTKYARDMKAVTGVFQ